MNLPAPAAGDGLRIQTLWSAGWIWGLFLRDGKAAGSALPTVGSEHIGESGFEGLAVEAVADDLLPADDEATGVVLVLALALQVGFEFGPDGLGLGLQFLHLGFDALELGDAVVQLTVGHVGTLLFVLVWAGGVSLFRVLPTRGMRFPGPV